MLSKPVERKMKSVSRTDWWNLLLFLVPWVAYAIVMLILFHRQTVHYAGNYDSDIDPYVLYMQGIDTGYTFPYPIMFWLGKLFWIFLNPKMAMAFSVAALNALTVPFLKYYTDRYVKRFCEWKISTAVLSTVLTFSMLFVSMLFMDLGPDSIGARYEGVFSPNPFHNATYLATRPFSVVCFFLLADLLETYETKTDRKKYILFSAFLLLTTMAKPSFVYGFIIMAAVILLYRTCKKKFANFKETMMLAACAIPSFVVLLYQFGGLFTGTNSRGEAAGIGIGFLDAWSMLEKPIGEAILLGLAFPLTVFLCNIKNLKKENEYRLSVQMLLVNLLMVMFLYEKGYRMDHVNFAWGYMHGMFFSYALSVMLLLKNTRLRKQPLPLLVLQWGLYLWHLVCGIVYFADIMAGSDFG